MGDWDFLSNHSSIVLVIDGISGARGMTPTSLHYYCDGALASCGGSLISSVGVETENMLVPNLPNLWGRAS